MNNDTIHVDPHIIHYTVHITDMYNENIITKRNVTETQFSPNIQGDDLCPMYRVSAWNAGGEGELSAPVQESAPQGKPTKEDFLHKWSTQAVFTVLTLLYFYHAQFLGAENITIAVEPDALRILIYVILID